MWDRDDVRAASIHPSAYAGLDRGIRFAVRVLHAAGIETDQFLEAGMLARRYETVFRRAVTIEDIERWAREP
jgi:hypothetical protein